MSKSGGSLGGCDAGSVMPRARSTCRLSGPNETLESTSYCGPGNRDNRVAGRNRRGVERDTAAEVALPDKRLFRIGQSAGEESFHADFGSRRDAGDDVA